MITGSVGSVAPEGPNLDRPHASDRMASGNLDCFPEAVAFDDVESADRLLRLREGAVGDDRLAVTDADRPSTTRRRELVARLPDPALAYLVQPRKALLRRRLGGIWLDLSIHVLRAPADHQHELHREAPLFGSVSSLAYR